MVSLIGVALLLVIFVMLRVINELRKTKKWLLKSESRLELALEGADEGLWDADFTTGEIFLSHRFATLLEYDNANELSLNFENYRDLFHPSDRHQVSEAYRMHESGKAPVFRCEARMLTKTEQYKWFSVHGKIIERYAMGEPLRMTGTLTNIQQQKEFENKLKEAKEKAEESDLLKSAFLANMSHEIRTPMNAILGFTDLLIHEVSDQEEQETYLKMIKSSGENLLNLINDIIDISKIESGQLQINHQHFDLHQLLKETAGIAENLLGQTGRAIQFKTSYYVNNQEFFIKTDPFRLRQILFNLITNAIKFTDEGYIETGYIIRNSHELEFFVKDTGIGISHHHQQIIFERFRQAHDNSLKQYGGTGLGLAITQSLVAMMDGDIWVRSVPGEGAEFRFRLPCNPSQN
jgi:signal transduction histidine kinase